MFCYPALELFVLFDSSRAFPLSIPVDNNEATWKKATKYNKIFSTWCNVHYECLIVLSGVGIYYLSERGQDISNNQGMTCDVR